MGIKEKELEEWLFNQLDKPEIIFSTGQELLISVTGSPPMSLA